MMGSKVYNLNIKELIKTLTELSQQHEFVDFEIDTSDDMDSRLVMYPLINSNNSAPVNHKSILDPTKGPDDLIRDLT